MFDPRLIARPVVAACAHGGRRLSLFLATTRRSAASGTHRLSSSRDARRGRVPAFLVAATLAACAHGPTVGALLASGAHKVEAPTLRTLIAGHRLQNRFMGADREWTHAADGTLAGTSVGTQGQRSPGSGTWRVHDDGRYCVDIRWAGIGSPEAWCCYVFQRGSEFFDAPSDHPGAGHVHAIGLVARP